VPPSGGQQFSDWSAPINLGPVVNSAGTDQGPAISKDELELYFVREVGGVGLGDLWVSTREHKKDPWGDPQNLGDKFINTSARESTPALSRDGLRLYFSSAGHGGFGGFDIWVSERTDRRDPLGWKAPVNLNLVNGVNGDGVNTAGAELGPAPFEDPSTQTFILYFYRIVDPKSGDRDLFTSTFDDEIGAFGTAVPITELNTTCTELNTTCNEEQPSLRRDGLEMFLASNRPGGFGGSDIWVSTRATTSDPWSCPVNLGSSINTAGTEQRPALSFDGRSLYFFSDRPGGFGATDLYVSTRTRLDDFDDGDDDD